MPRLVQIKEIFGAVLIFLLPIMSYTHLYFERFNLKYPDIEIVIKEYFGVGTSAVVYYLLFWGAAAMMFVLWHKLCNKCYKQLIILLMLLNIYHLIIHLFYINHGFVIAIFSLIYFYIVYLFFKERLSKQNFKTSKKDFWIAITIILMPIVHFTYRIYPNETMSLNYLFVEIKDFGFQDARTALYYILAKATILMPIIIWFLMEKKWWKYALLSPIIIYSYQYINIFDVHATEMDVFELSQSGPILLALAVFLVLLSKAVENQSRIKTFLEAIYIKIEEKVAGRFESRQNFIEEKRQKLNQSIDELIELEELKSELERELHKR